MSKQEFCVPTADSDPLALFKATDRSSNTSPDMPNKKPRLGQQIVATTQADGKLTADRHSMPDTSNLALPHESVKTPQNGEILPHHGVTSPVERPTTNGLYTNNVKEPDEIKSPHLPLGENVAIATAAGAP